MPPPLPPRDRGRRREPDEYLGTPIPKSAPPEVRDLGEPFHGEDASGSARIGMWVCAGFGAAVGVMALLAAVFEPIVGGIFGVVAVVLLFVALNLLFSSSKASRWWACPGGFVWQEGPKLSWATWEEVRVFRPKVTTFVNEDLSLFGKDISTWQLHEAVIGFSNGREHELEGEELVADVLRRVLKALVRHYLDKLERGKRVSLSPFKLTRERLTFEDEEIAWDRVAEVSAERNTIFVRTRRAIWAEVPLEECNLASVFVALAGGLARRSAPGRPAGERDPFDFG
jgi:hypothetical protein